MLLKPHQIEGKKTLTAAQRKFKRLQFCEKQKWRCALCGCKMSRYSGECNSATLGHRKCEPAGCAKDDSDDNLIGAICWTCNYLQGSRPA